MGRGSKLTSKLDELGDGLKTKFLDDFVEETDTGLKAFNDSDDLFNIWKLNLSKFKNPYSIPESIEITGILKGLKGSNENKLVKEVLRTEFKNSYYLAGDVHPELNGFEYIRHNNVKGAHINKKIGIVVFDRFQKPYNGNTGLNGGFASPFKSAKYNMIDLVYTYDSRALMDKLEDGVYYLKFRIKKPESFVFNVGSAIPWKTKSGEKMIEGAEQVQIKNKKFHELKEGVDYDIVQKYEKKSSGGKYTLKIQECI